MGRDMRRAGRSVGIALLAAAAVAAGGCRKGRPATAEPEADRGEADRGAERGEVGTALDVRPAGEDGASGEASDARADVGAAEPALGTDGGDVAGDAADVADDAAADAGAAADAEFVVPPENREGAARPGLESAEALARELLAALVSDGPPPDLMFPLGAFERLKDLPDPGAYHRRLVRWYGEDFETERARWRRASVLELEEFRFGRCTWQAVGTEGNLLPYWSCRRNKVRARADGRPVEIEIRVLINWGPSWYVAHLGPVRR